ncbi:hypothetical protein OHS70_09825 [Streptomyces sp. NBC_00390]|uniref:hypothetical protein n=1 Tax=Streptomyces sp. NBC_00390 TaxID=2975736 RepID=UPI002E1C0B4E
MSDEKQQKPDTKLPETPQEHQQDQAKDQSDIEGGFAATDMVERMRDAFDVFGLGSTGSVFGSTAFDGRKLNEMLAFLESANPADLEDAGDALEKANVAINKAATELDDFVKKTDWKGEGATAFQEYGAGVVSYAWSIGKMANAAGAQMKVASTGLASVRNARPPGDDRTIRKEPKDFELPEQTADNPEYQKALQVEKDRQEAINQMNRLASFYAVSQGMLAKQKEPLPPAAYKAAVPAPTGWFEPGTDSGTGEARDSLSRGTSGHASSVGEAGVTETAPRTEALGKTGSIADFTSMEIDSVTTAPPPTTTAPNTTPPTPVSNPNQGGGPVSPPPTNFGLPGRAAPVPRTGDPRTAGGPPSKAVGRAGTPGGSQPLGRPATSTGRPPGTPSGTSTGRSPMVGRPSATGIPGGGGTGRSVTGAGRGQAPIVGRPGGTGQPVSGRSGGQAPIVGRPGGTGQPVSGRSGGQAPIVGRPGGTGQPVAGRSGGPNGPRGGRGDGIVGGTPQRSTSGSTGSRIPRGTIIGGDGPAAGRSSAARPSQAGVVGANPGNTAARPVGRGTPSVNGVVGTPRAPGSRPGTGAAAGGGLAGGRANQRRPGEDEQDREGTARPDYLTEDEETWANRRRGAVPPVID